ncbi:DUF2892 domain-containing protein [Fibrella sp. WM1]|uniref:YgaP family membrane protein n=1 Tax=Fibrella musci TaxID=3242485 RepID=UPI0035209D8D
MINTTKNVGFLDRLVRGLIAVDLLAVCFITTLSSLVIAFFCLLAGYFIYTALTGFCPIYTAVGRNTRQRTEP